MNMLSLFAGVGGLDLAAHMAGIKTVAFCEIEPYAQQVLRKRFPGVPIFDDVRKLTAKSLKEVLPDGPDAKIDIICGGFP
jgi:DNA (cytosine-5)-methyltransferase 1